MPAPKSGLNILSPPLDVRRGAGIRSLDLYVDDSEGAAGHLEILYADLVPLPEEG